MKVHIQSLFVGFVAGVATAALLPVLVPAVSEGARPLAKALLKHSLLGIERARGAVARASESIEDLVAEVRAEVDSQLSASASARAASARAASAMEASKSAVAVQSRSSTSMVS
jgi:hypothetical protein